ncbi:Fumarate reductase/succinate dehydrogenase flavoprotein domain protein [Tepidanaerobacter acetatoxydans Re1]|uniref:Fumarate reductase/succinate dehydrogenase flavoprotein domain protein n=1 Tax=Tepidanaerobacter acetatoxydans (strain DSM 21804 / JCM 16047 / Re1) TaxID=1209989 RepID=F4LXM3_TEPAE|nr:FAD-binding protein [Tepidanaerobacter acetatoxydans]AEE91952.1 fumarate reductase/succinate dehydrogenase flavoprotein domain protein [Tepidanaerobacter acetatoxydans Re1]CDI40861.1 Fumarate reductase/succinate dehydrogenase flavoprotein domain protein [Tepidanaerobacter acetatoxydans Re1]
MIESSIKIMGYDIKVYSLNTVVVGTGAAGLNAADRLSAFGQKDIAIVTENLKAGTSRNTGSDKQTYYKLTLAGSEPDSVYDFAETLFEGLCVDGDIALCEAALSTQCFLKLAELGVPFPRNRYGEYVGYKTDHDPKRRATSAGPYTSKYMTKCLENSVKQKNIKIFDKMQVIKILTDGNKLLGLLCLDVQNSQNPNRRYVAFNCKNVIYAAGGPAGMYADSVYPFSQRGASGIAFEAGIMGKNLTEWQYGLASVKPRWNVSGTYMQVLPRFISTDKNGNDEREFLADFFKYKGDMLSKIFLKGYQWPFDVRKVSNGSSIIDILVYIETCIKGRRVFLDFSRNPGDSMIDFSKLSSEAKDYLEKSGATFGTPIERLMHMNAPAVKFYKEKGVDLTSEPLEIAVCAQHNNGGLSINKWWQTNIEGFFAAGEVSASHGVYRPGGTALNAGQVGSTRAAQYIAANRKGAPADSAVFAGQAAYAIADAITMGEAVFSDCDNVREIWDNAAKRMSRFGGAIRSIENIAKAAEEVRNELMNFNKTVKVSSASGLCRVYRLHDMLLSQYVYLEAMLDYVRCGGKSRGSALYTDKNGIKPHDALPDLFTFTLDDGTRGDMVQEVIYQNGKCEFIWRKVRQIPKDDDFFENVWRTYRKNGNIY